VLTELHAHVEATATMAVDRRTRSTWLTGVIRQCQTLSAILSETMSHDDAYCFFTVGRQIERADLTTRVLDVQGAMLMRQADQAIAPYIDTCWFAALRSVSALQAFRRSGAPMTPEATVGFLLHDLKCPRTIEACLVEVGRWMLEIPGHEQAMARCASAVSALHEVDTAALVTDGLHGFADGFQRCLGELHQSIEDSWFAPASVRDRAG
jgi:uncharacterized alpha-E superfamily protein